ncbi:MAG: DUF5671 domain-containing protein [bacterium]
MENTQNIVTSKYKLNIGFFFLCLGLLITLVTSVVSLLNLIFSVLDKQFPDVLNATYQYGYSSYSYDSIRASLATLIIFFPIFLVVSFFWRKCIKGEMSHVDEVIKKWVIYIILFLSAIVVAIDLVVLVRYFVSGEITSRFIYKVLATFVTAAIIGKYFYISEFWKKEGLIKKLNKIINPVAAILLVSFAIGYSFFVMGSPAKQRLLRLDDKRVTDLQSIQYQIINYWQQKEKLPESLGLLSNPMTGFSLPVPPNFTNGEKYVYNIKDEKKLTFELCADFSLAMPKGWQENGGYYGGSVVPIVDKTSTNVQYPVGGTNDSWDHQTGNTCFLRTIDKDIYPPFQKVK